MQVFHSYKNKLLSNKYGLFWVLTKTLYSEKMQKIIVKCHFEICNYLELENLHYKNDIKISRIPINLNASFIVIKHILVWYNSPIH